MMSAKQINWEDLQREIQEVQRDASSLQMWSMALGASPSELLKMPDSELAARMDALTRVMAHPNPGNWQTLKDNVIELTKPTNKGPYAQNIYRKPRLAAGGNGNQSGAMVQFNDTARFHDFQTSEFDNAWAAEDYFKYADRAMDDNQFSMRVIKLPTGGNLVRVRSRVYLVGDPEAIDEASEMHDTTFGDAAAGALGDMDNTAAEYDYASFTEGVGRQSSMVYGQGGGWGEYEDFEEDAMLHSTMVGDNYGAVCPRY